MKEQMVFNPAEKTVDEELLFFPASHLTTRVLSLENGIYVLRGNTDYEKNKRREWVSR